MSENNYHLFILQNLDGCPANMRESFMDAGFSTEICDEAHIITSKHTEASPAIILANGGDDEDSALEVAKSLIEQEPLRSTPLLFIGKHAAEMGGALERFFETVITLNTPFLRNEGIEAVRFLSTQIVEIEEQTAEIGSETLRGEDFTSLTEQSIETLVFSQLSALQGDHFGGKEFSRNISLEQLEELGICNFPEKIKVDVRTTLEQLTPWAADHICRTAFISHSFHQALSLTEELRTSAHIATFCLFSRFSKQSLDLLKRNYLTASDELRNGLASKLKDSALHTMGEMEESRAAKLITLAARYIGKEEKPDDSLEAVSSSLIVAAELIDRICFEPGFWNPRSAYGLIRATTQGQLDFLHPLATASMMKFLSEALAHMPKTFLIKDLEKNNPEHAERARQNEAYIPLQDEERITLDRLEPGMKLSQPIFAYDGRKILSGEVQLDQDLIWRLWRLSSIRPMNTPLVVKKDFH
ncbi:hypothetical protein MRY87_04565 [bacterium]|nr:hypothetical protein [bacterium]